jgi:hypothetical protein
MKNIKLISSFFLPYRNANAIAIARKMEYLSENKYEIETFTYDLEGFNVVDNDFKETMKFKNIHVITRYLNKTWKRISDVFSAVKKIDNNGDIIISYFHLIETAYLCLRLKKRDNIPWISIFSDPPHHISPFRDGTYFRHFLYMIKRQDFFLSYIPTKIALKYSDKLIFNDLWQAKFILGDKYEKYEDKIEIIQMGANIFQGVHPAKENSKIVFRYLGELYSQRNGVEFILAVDELVNKFEKYKDKIIIEFYGTVFSQETFDAHKNMKNKEVISFKGPVSYTDSLDLMKSADVLLVLDANLEKLTEIYPYTPSKLIDYIGAKKPIMAVSMKNSPTHDICEETGNWWSTFDKQKIQEALLDCIENYSSHSYSSDLLYQYSSENKSKQFEAVIDGLLEQK